MRRIPIVIATAALAVIAGTFVAQEVTKAVPRGSKSEAPAIRRPVGRVLYAVVDADGIYLGEARVAFQHAIDAINGTLRHERIRNLYIYGTSDAKFGDLVRLHAGVDQSLIDYCSFSCVAIPPGARKPLTGIIQQGMCGPIFADGESSNQ